MRRTTLVAALIAFFLLPGAAAWAEGPSGSTEDNKREVKCGEGTDTPAGRMYAGANGVEACSDSGEAPDGRIIVDFSGQYASVDGDPTNGENANGFIRLDPSGPSCGNDQNYDSSKGAGGGCP